MTFFALYLGAGAIAGLMAGLLGIGGGMVIVPMLTYTFIAHGIPHEYVLHMALGTSLASIIFTSLSSVRAHHQRGAVNWQAVTRITPGILVGTFVGAWIAAQLSTNFLKVFFACFLLYVATQMLVGLKPKSTRTLPGAAGMFGAGGTIGIFSSLVGIGGGTLSVPFLSWCNTEMRKAIATSSAIGFPIAIAGTAGYIVNGRGIDVASPHLGYIHLTGLLGIVLASVCTAPFGARLTHTLPVDKLKKIFSILLYVVGTKMLIGGL